MMQIGEKYTFGFGQFEQEKHLAQGNRVGEQIQVAIIESHLLLREALQRMVGHFPQMAVCASLCKAQDAVALHLRGNRHVLLLGSSITLSECLECTRALKNEQSVPGIVVIQQRLYPETAFSLMRNGVQGLLGEDASEKDLAQAIEAAAQGQIFLGTRAREILSCSMSRAAFHFTEREVQILSLLRLGITNFHIAQRLGLKEKTIEKHLTHIYEKLHISSRTEAILRTQTLAI